jgi:hypothetical protein
VHGWEKVVFGVGGAWVCVGSEYLWGLVRL